MKLIVLISIAVNLFVGSVKQREDPIPVHWVTADSAAHYKLAAYKLLQIKCNVCHEQRNRNAVFTCNNMNAWGTQINEQVFIKKRMPKGNAIVLTDADRQLLKKWLNTLK
ncbi:hypothetical protein [Cytophaga hutchinsonii]|uniref:Cytochrome c domain-containing protein n=1 Tax=Cytophaga hutchinsonii (strain ATCC 33406 / DSM 1761 / CIP 103989 / NBRC 15051 / NCIMB 9469 / D465) TaxID=269798 RepID=A0A6N4SPW6_CYTH3|nr:hypothetical protein [Cytophaga hutchinsonii]ABG58375.1 hypothetical protein CHU_1098 [Cytophaga hutchinsonii ATCC 33406]SFX51448.1 hypothetical protein SAMN04487930_10555 [Cytophaga hutchinsonii ATCC 33406]